MLGPDILKFRHQLQDELCISRAQSRLLTDAIEICASGRTLKQMRLPAELASMFMGGGGRAIPIHHRGGPVCIYIARPPELVGTDPVPHVDTLRQCFATVLPKQCHVISSIHEIIRVFGSRYRLDFSDLFRMLRRAPLVCLNRKQKWSNA